MFRNKNELFTNLSINRLVMVNGSQRMAQGACLAKGRTAWIGTPEIRSWTRTQDFPIVVLLTTHLKMSRGLFKFSASGATLRYYFAGPLVK